MPRRKVRRPKFPAEHDANLLVGIVCAKTHPSGHNEELCSSSQPIGYIEGGSTGTVQRGVAL
ncbi:hypothetical protein HETIRDRAFT_409605 [Heterobasidion irregulare TC 32-1]|uniref:Uncharacterized protein n=1 Tax=Heterobasidion irregulare (strain TC 32-1) TaxID=747525 RepID=W4K927_HETIT|nr:uncharacterized protein HETIRDRAFT_409605 [Heterobasidion irregulare TC 32-1]ETW81845.1 hypothetical protein HETIRDRAFT_409605 [Heterobasidion irregulare TC 32-1]